MNSVELFFEERGMTAGFLEILAALREIAPEKIANAVPEEKNAVIRRVAWAEAFLRRAAEQAEKFEKIADAKSVGLQVQ